MQSAPQAASPNAPVRASACACARKRCCVRRRFAGTGVGRRNHGVAAATRAVACGRLNAACRASRVARRASRVARHASHVERRVPHVARICIVARCALHVAWCVSPAARCTLCVARAAAAPAGRGRTHREPLPRERVVRREASQVDRTAHGLSPQRAHLRHPSSRAHARTRARAVRWMGAACGVAEGVRSLSRVKLVRPSVAGRSVRPSVAAPVPVAVGLGDAHPRARRAVELHPAARNPQRATRN